MTGAKVVPLSTPLTHASCQPTGRPVAPVMALTFLTVFQTRTHFPLKSGFPGRSTEVNTRRRPSGLNLGQLNPCADGQDPRYFALILTVLPLFRSRR